MNQKNIQSQFDLIIRTLLSTQNTDPRIIREHVNRYAQDAGVPYELARQAVILKAQAELTKRTEQL